MHAKPLSIWERANLRLVAITMKYKGASVTTNQIPSRMTYIALGIMYIINVLLLLLPIYHLPIFPYSHSSSHAPISTLAKDTLLPDRSFLIRFHLPPAIDTRFTVRFSQASFAESARYTSILALLFAYGTLEVIIAGSIFLVQICVTSRMVELATKITNV
jgi:hypothetical protein